MNRKHILRSFCLKLQAAESLLNGNVEQTETAQVKIFLETTNTLARYQITKRYSIRYITEILQLLFYHYYLGKSLAVLDGIPM